MTPSDLLTNKALATDENPPQSPAFALRATLALIWSLTSGKACVDCQTASLLARRAIEEGNKKGSLIRHRCAELGEG